MTYDETVLVFHGMFIQTTHKEDWYASEGNIVGAVEAFLDTCDVLCLALCFHMDDIDDA